MEIDKVRLLEPARAPEALGRVLSLADAAKAARNADPLWRDADMGNVVLIFAKAAIDIGRHKVTDYMTRGLSIATGIFAAKQVGVDAVKGPALFRSVRSILAKVAAGELAEDDAWVSCTKRMDQNQRIVRYVLGGAAVPVFNLPAPADE